jgi:hypothetical protein
MDIVDSIVTAGAAAAEAAAYLRSQDRRDPEVSSVAERSAVHA